jgi:methyl-accepting chemotaxis protein
VAAALAAEAMDAIKENGRLHAAVTPELAWLIDKRVNRYLMSRTQGVVAGVSFTLVIVYLLVGLFVSVRRSARSLKEATKRMIIGTEEQFVSPSRDELGDVALDYNDINAALVQSRKLQYQVQQDNDALQANIMELLQVVSEASEGDLRVRARITTGALGNVADALNSLFESLEALLGDVNKQVEATNESVARIADAARGMSDGATKQAQEVLAAVQMVETMSSKINMVSENAGRAANAAIGTRSSAQEGAQAILAVISGMEQLRANVQAGAKKMKNLGDRSMEITSIVETISRISEQTNMLALNAAIEAARAGEHGRGFSVVAEQVGKLADRAATATQEIDKIIKSIHGETTDTVQAIEQQTAVVEKQGQVVSTAGSSLEKIREVSTESAALVTDISTIAKAQVDGTRSVVNTMEQISKIARTTQEGAAGTVKTAHDLVQRSQKLTASIRRFKTAA